MPKANIKTFAVFAMIFLMLSVACMPALTFAKGKRDKDEHEHVNIEWVVDGEFYKEAVVEVNGETFYMTAESYEDGWKITNINGEPQNSNYVTVTVIPRPPYPWWVWMGDVVALRFYLDAPTAMNIDTALAVMALLTSLAGSYGGIYGLIAAAVMGLLYIGYHTLYSDHYPDGSWSLWIPVDWYNALIYAYSHALYVATCHYWWYAILSVVPWNIGTHSYWT